MKLDTIKGTPEMEVMLVQKYLQAGKDCNFQ